MTSLGMALGTPAYMSPEQAAADPSVDHRADIYAWGVLAYELLTGATPFAGRPAAAMLAAHVSVQPAPVSSRRPSLPPALAMLVMRCLAKRPSDRPQSASEIVAALDNLSTPAGTAVQGDPSAARPARRMLITVGAVCLTLAVLAAVIVPRYVGARSTRALAVMPFENASGDSSLNYLAEGMSDEVRSRLTRIPGLQVKARASSMVLRGRGADPQSIGTQLGVTDALVGSLRQNGARLHVTAELVRTTDGTASWSGAFDVPLASSAAVQDSITLGVTDYLRVRDAAPRDAARARGTADDEAYNLFLRGEYHRRRFDYITATSYLERAVAKDPRFLRALASLAVTYAYLPSNGMANTDSARALAASAIQRAVAIAPNDPDVLFAQGIELYYKLHFREAVTVLRRVVALQPDNSEAHVQLAFVLGNLGQLDESIREQDRARALDPLSIDALIGLQYSYYQAHRPAEADSITPLVLSLAPDSYFGYNNLALIHLANGKYAEASAAAAKVERIDPRISGIRSWLYYIESRTGNTAKAAQHKRLLLTEATNSPNYPTFFIALTERRYDDAVAALERGVRGGEALWVQFNFTCDPIVDPLKSMPRFKALAAEVGASICPPSK